MDERVLHEQGMGGGGTCWQVHERPDLRDMGAWWSHSGAPEQRAPSCEPACPRLQTPSSAAVGSSFLTAIMVEAKMAQLRPFSCFFHSRLKQWRPCLCPSKPPDLDTPPGRHISVRSLPDACCGRPRRN